MKETSIHVLDDGPYQIEGDFKIVDDSGETFQVNSSVSLCRCGQSENKPFCDNTHEKIHFKSKPRAKDNLMVEV